MHRSVYAISALLVLGALTSSLLLDQSRVEAAQAQERKQQLSDLDQALPEFANSTFDGAEWTMEELQGKPWIVNFWATWCGPCVEEMPAMNRAWEEIESEGIGMVGINAGESKQVIAAFLEKVPVDFPVLLGDADTLPDWEVRALPTTYVVNAEGRIVHVAVGPREWDDPELLDRVRALLPN